MLINPFLFSPCIDVSKLHSFKYHSNKAIVIQSIHLVVTYLSSCNTVQDILKLSLVLRVVSFLVGGTLKRSLWFSYEQDYLPVLGCFYILKALDIISPVIIMNKRREK